MSNAAIDASLSGSASGTSLRPPMSTCGSADPAREHVGNDVELWSTSRLDTSAVEHSIQVELRATDDDGNYTYRLDDFACEPLRPIAAVTVKVLDVTPTSGHLTVNGAKEVTVNPEEPLILVASVKDTTSLDILQQWASFSVGSRRPMPPESMLIDYTFPDALVQQARILAPDVWDLWDTQTEHFQGLARESQVFPMGIPEIPSGAIHSKTHQAGPRKCSRAA